MRSRGGYMKRGRLYFENHVLKKKESNEVFFIVHTIHFIHLTIYMSESIHVHHWMARQLNRLNWNFSWRAKVPWYIPWGGQFFYSRPREDLPYISLNSRGKRTGTVTHWGRKEKLPFSARRRLSIGYFIELLLSTANGGRENDEVRSGSRLRSQQFFTDQKPSFNLDFQPQTTSKIRSNLVRLHILGVAEQLCSDALIRVEARPPISDFLD